MKGKKQKDARMATSGLSAFLNGVGAGIGIFLALMIFCPDVLNTPYKLESQKEYIAFHLDTTDFPMAVLDETITMFEDNGINPEAIVFVKNRKPVSQIRLSPPKTLGNTKKLIDRGIKLLEVEMDRIGLKKKGAKK